MGQPTTLTPPYDKRESILSQWQSQSKLHVSAASTASGCFKSGGSFTSCRNPRAPDKRTSLSTQAGFLEEADWLLRSRRCHSLAAASTTVERASRVRGSQGVPRGHPHPAPTAASPASRDQTGSRVTCRGAWGRRACRPPQQGTRRAGEAVWVGAGRAAARGGGGGGGGPAAPRPRHVVRGGQPSCYKHKQRGAATAGAPAPLPLPPPPPPASRAPPARPLPPTPRDRSPAPPASRGKRSAAPRPPARGRPAPDAEAAAPSLQEPEPERGLPARTFIAALEAAAARCVRLLAPLSAPSPARPPASPSLPGGGCPRPGHLAPLPEGHAVLRAGPPPSHPRAPNGRPPAPPKPGQGCPVSPCQHPPPDPLARRRPARPSPPGDCSACHRVRVGMSWAPRVFRSQHCTWANGEASSSAGSAPEFTFRRRH